MTQIADRYRALSARFADILAAVPADRWAAASPCTEWTVLDVARHVVEVHGLFEKLAGRPIDVPSVDDGVLAGFRTVQRIVQTDLDDPERATTTWQGYFGTTTFEAAIDRFVDFDLIVHGWDIASGAGIDSTLPADELERLELDLEFFGDALKGSRVTGPDVPVPDDADPQTRLLARAGRAADWVAPPTDHP